MLVKRPRDGPRLAAALRDGGYRTLVYIFDPSPQLRVHMSKTLTATYFYENFVPLLLLERLINVLHPPA